MATYEEKQKALKKLQPRMYYIHGIFNFKTKELVFVSLDEDEVTLRFDLEGYDTDYDVVRFPITIH